MKVASKLGFTVVEIVVVITIIVILSAISIVGYRSLQANARDNTRSANAAVISAGLEKFYEKNGAYPSVISLSNGVSYNTGAIVAAKLGISEKNLLMPNMPTTTTNGIASGTTPVNNYLMYEASSVTNNSWCQTNTIGGCERYTLRYQEESSGTVVVIESLRR